jgi:pilus assembly protein TadC
LLILHGACAWMKPLTELLLPVAQWLNSPALKRVVAALTDGEKYTALGGRRGS